MPVSSFEFLNTLIEPESDVQQQAEASLISIVLKPIRIAKQKKHPSIFNGFYWAAAKANSKCKQNTQNLLLILKSGIKGHNSTV